MQDWGGDAVLSLEEAAAFLRVSETTVYQLLREGQLRARKVGREWRFLKSNLVAYLKEGGETTEARVMPDDINGGEYRVEDGQEKVALWLPMTREQKRQLIAQLRKSENPTSATEIAMNAFKNFLKDFF
jgi:excisionase family DNA binding protein